ncbi:MAG TPA: hypothetical protein VKC66_29890 [Xanthobacteraceae bacterium]|nr:hypothetical protein [Xanthobacteraceae bacterium]
MAILKTMPDLVLCDISLPKDLRAPEALRQGGALMATRKITLIVAAGVLSFAAGAYSVGPIGGWLKSGLARAEWLLTADKHPWSSVRSQPGSYQPRELPMFACKILGEPGTLLSRRSLKFPLPWVNLPKRLMAAEFFGVGRRAAILYEVRQAYPQHLPA